MHISYQSHCNVFCWNFWKFLFKIEVESCCVGISDVMITLAQANVVSQACASLLLTLVQVSYTLFFFQSVRNSHFFRDSAVPRFCSCICALALLQVFEVFVHVDVFPVCRLFHKVFLGNEPQYQFLPTEWLKPTWELKVFFLNMNYSLTLTFLNTFFISSTRSTVAPSKWV